MDENGRLPASAHPPAPPTEWTDADVSSPQAAGPQCTARSAQRRLPDVLRPPRHLPAFGHSWLCSCPRWGKRRTPDCTPDLRWACVMRAICPPHSPPRRGDEVGGMGGRQANYETPGSQNTFHSVASDSSDPASVSAKGGHRRVSLASASHAARARRMLKCAYGAED